jgi:chorismate dehydratase
LINKTILQKPLYKVTAVSYLNTKPFLYGLYSSPLIEYLDIELNPPAVCAEKISSGKADIGLIPVGALLDLPSFEIISNYCIGAKGEVKTVCVFSEVPLEQIETLMLDYQSRTSVKLVQLLLNEHWKKSVILQHASPGYIEKIKGNTAGLVIGDKAIELLSKYKYTYDLSQEWYHYTGGLPFVFAVWVSIKPLEPLFESLFNKACKEGIERIPELTKIIPNPNTEFSLKKYLEENISYEFDEEKQASLNQFLTYIKSNANVLQ